MSDNVQEDEPENTVRAIKTATDLQRLKLEKLLKQPEKPVFIPDRPKERKMPKPPEFIRNTWGSSAGAGSGDFHVYRGVRRREYARQKFLDEKESKLTKDEAYQKKLQENVQAAEERTAKKRAKRLKKKQKSKQKKKSQTAQVESETESDDDENEPDQPLENQPAERVTESLDAREPEQHSPKDNCLEQAQDTRCNDKTDSTDGPS